METKQRIAILNDKKKIIKQICPDIQNKAGIYLFYRTNDKGEKCSYVGQSKNVWNRCADHIWWYKGKTQHIDKSIYVHKLYSKDNPFGWKLEILYFCDYMQLDEMEQSYIDYFLKNGYKSYNVTGGGQINKKADIGERQQTKLKSHKNGKIQGYNKAKKEVCEFFDKYLDFTIKGKTSKIKERKFNEFKKWLNKGILK